ncbi:MAG: bifunctional (p)ppGpp synthetase/guanosine-3',5'-bis(diphosphate) 3'-pyrophosphohydrolase [Lachnospiraceae bacterium]|nr:bifunctional (p)ppGpp synthetase/guanosine-3',5'-bis(diphosphate) 3'-pyrophosphohydrolase [Lachnospiraceae bacterium]
MVEQNGYELSVIRRGVGIDDSLATEKNYENAPQELYDALIRRIRKYHPSDDISLIERAYDVAYKAHEGQLRKSGEPYIIHPLHVAIILADLELDLETIAAGLLHDVVEDTIYTNEQMTEMFGADVALLVDGVTKLKKIKLPADFTDKSAAQQEMQAENLRKMFLAMVKDIRVILIKLADRLHNMRTLQYMIPEKQKRIAQETLDIYSPIASRLGISKIKVELDDLSLKYLKPDIFQNLVEKVAERKSEREEYVHQIADEVSQHLKEAGIEGRVDGRVKHFFSIYKKMVNQGKSMDQIYDLFAVRIIVRTVKDCYAALGVIHEMYKPIPGRFKDYIAMPKPNGYQSLHTTLIGKQGLPFEIQIRTYEMHREAEYGIAAHWKYKVASDGKKIDASEQEKLLWLRQILEFQQSMSDNQEFLELLKSDLDLFSDSVYCFTPEGEVKNLPAGSTTIDFAYSIHTAVGNKMVGARVNGKLVNIDYEIQNGDLIEIITSQNSRGPSLDWLSICKSASAKNKINQWFKKDQKEENIIRGKELLAAYCKAHSIVPSDIMKPEYQDAVLKKYGFREWDALMAAIGHGGLKEGQVVNKLAELFEKDHQAHLTDEEILQQVEENAARKKITNGTSPITVRGIHDVAVHFARCCSPVPGDEIVGFVTRGRGVTIHRTDCINIMNLQEMDRVRIIEAEWEEGAGEKKEKGGFEAEINVYCTDRNGLLADISRVFTERGISIIGLNTRTNKQGYATLSISFRVSGKAEMDSTIEKLRQIRNVIDITRTNG